MPTHKEIAEAVAILTAGRIVPAVAKTAAAARKEAQAFRALSRSAQARTAASTIGRGGRFVGRQAITKSPWGIAALLLYEGYIHREELADLAISLGGTMQEALEFYEGETGGPPVIGGFGLQRASVEDVMRGQLGQAPRKRKVSKANRAVKVAMGWLKGGTKAQTGSKPGVLPKNSFRTSVKAAGMANPSTPSKPGKGKSILNKIARRLKKWW